MKRLSALSILLLLMSLMSLTAFAQRPKVGVVLCGGGAKGAAHVGALKVLEENNIPIDCIAGTSMGAIIAGLYAIGYTAGELDSLFMAQDWDFLMSDRIPRHARYFEHRKEQDKYLIRIPFSAGDYSRLGARAGRKPDEGSVLSTLPLAMVGGQNIYNLFTRLSVGYQDSLDFNRMPIPFACVAVDLIGKKEVVFRSGHFVDAIRASMAIPGYFSPVRIGGMVLIDGGALNNFPVDVCREMGADIIIGVLLGEVEKKDPAIENIGDLAGEMMALYVNTKYPNAKAHTDILITPGTKGYNTLSFDTKSLRTLIDNGEAAAREKQDELTAMKERLDRSQKSFIGPVKQPERYRKVVHLDRDSITLGNISFNGLTAKDAHWLLGKSALQSGTRISGKMLEREIARFYNTGAFESVTYLLKGQNEPYDLDLNFVSGRKSVIGLGFRFDSEEVAAILVNAGLNENALYGSKFSATAKLAYNMQADLQYTYAFKSLTQINIGYSFRTSNLNLMRSTVRSNMNFRDHALTAMFLTSKTHVLAIDMGIRFNILQYRSLLGFANESKGLYSYDPDRNKFLSAFARFQIDQLDQEYFPTHGYAFDGEFNHYLDRLVNGHSDFSAARIHFTSVLPVGDRVAFLLSFDNRTLFGSDIPLTYANVMGGSQARRYLDQQIPFIGFGYTHVFKKVLSIATADTRFRILDNHYVFASGAYAQDFQDLKTIFEEKPVIGARLGYSYNSFFGPLSFNLFWSNYTQRVGTYVSLGYTF